MSASGEGSPGLPAVPGAVAVGAADSTLPDDAETAELEQSVRVLWAAVIRVPEDVVTRDADFYELGGDSLGAARILASVRKQFGVGITLDRLHEVQTVRSMAARIAAVRNEPAVGRRLS